VRPPVDEPRLRALARRLGHVARGPTRIYLTGGASAVLEGWRGSTADIDLRFEPDLDDRVRVGDAGEAARAYETIEPELYRYPAIDPSAFRQKSRRLPVRCSGSCHGVRRVGVSALAPG